MTLADNIGLLMLLAIAYPRNLRVMRSRPALLPEKSSFTEPGKWTAKEEDPIVIEARKSLLATASYFCQHEAHFRFSQRLIQQNPQTVAMSNRRHCEMWPPEVRRWGCTGPAVPRKPRTKLSLIYIILYSII